MVTLVGSIGIFDQTFFFLSYLLLGSIFLHFLPLLAEPSEEKKRGRASISILYFTLFELKSQKLNRLNLQQGDKEALGGVILHGQP